MSEQTPNSGDGNKNLDPMSIEFFENSEPRCACVLLVDCSESMVGNNIKQLNEGIKELKIQLENDDIASKRVEIAVVKFDSTAEVVSNFTTVDRFEPPELEARGVTSMTDAINLAANMIETRKKDYKRNGINYFRPWMFMVTAGEPTDEEGRVLEDSDPRLTGAIKTLHNGVNGKQFTFFAVGVDNANMQTLSKLSPKFPPKKLRGNELSEMFKWLSSSLVSMSSSIE